MTVKNHPEIFAELLYLYDLRARAREIISRELNWQYTMELMDGDYSDLVEKSEQRFAVQEQKIATIIIRINELNKQLGFDSENYPINFFDKET